MTDCKKTNSADTMDSSLKTASVVSFEKYQYKRQIEKNQAEASDYFNLAQMISGKETLCLRINGQRLLRDKKQLIIESLRMNPHNAMACLQLAGLMQPHESVALRPNKVIFLMSRTMLYKLAIRFDSSNADAFFDLALQLKATEQETISLVIDGEKREYGVQSLLAKAIECDPLHTSAYHHLSATLNQPNETITLSILGKVYELNQDDLIDLACGNA